MKLLESQYDPFSGITTNYYSDKGGTRVVIQRTMDVEPLIDQNTVERNSHSHKSRDRFRTEGLGTKVASIPFALVEKIKRETGFDIMTCTDEKRIAKFLNDSNYSKLRTAEGRV